MVAVSVYLQILRLARVIAAAALGGKLTGMGSGRAVYAAAADEAGFPMNPVVSETGPVAEPAVAVVAAAAVAAMVAPMTGGADASYLCPDRTL